MDNNIAAVNLEILARKAIDCHKKNLRFDLILTLAKIAGFANGWGNSIAEKIVSAGMSQDELVAQLELLEEREEKLKQKNENRDKSIIDARPNLYLVVSNPSTEGPFASSKKEV